MDSNEIHDLTAVVARLTEEIEWAAHGEYNRRLEPSDFPEYFKPLTDWFNRITEERTNLLDEVVRLQTVVNVSQKISSLDSLDSLLSLVADLAKATLEAEGCSIALVDETSGDLVFEYVEGGAADMILKMRIPKGKGVVGKCLQTGTPQIIQDVSQTESFFKDIDESTSFQTRNLVCTPLKYRDRIIGVLELVNAQDIDRFMHLKRTLFEAFANIAAVAIVNSILHKKAVETTRMERELEIAHQIQVALLPDRNPFPESFVIGDYYQAARFIGGDYYDVIHTGEKNLGIALADVSGKSISGALMMVVARSITRSAVLHQSNPGAILTEVNQKLVESTRQISAGMFVTMTYISLERKSGTLKYARAGHTPLLVYRGQTGQVEQIDPSGLALGLVSGDMFDENIKEVELTISPDDLCLLYTDGLSEAMSSTNEEFGEERIVKLLQQHGNRPIEEIIKMLAEGLKGFTAGADQSDDVTVVIFKYKGSTPETDAIAEGAPAMMSENATVTVVYTSENVSILKVKGFLNVHSRAEMDKAFEDILAEEKYNILVNLENLDFISSAGLALFIPIAKKVREQEGDIRFSNIPGKVIKIFEMLGFTKIFQTFENEQDGIASYDNPT